MRFGRIVVGFTVIAALLTLSLAVEVAYDNARLQSGPNAWFIVVTPTSRRTYTYEPYAQRVIGGGFSTERECDDALARLTGYVPKACRILLLSDAAKMGAPPSF
jgi:hypothetical protein